MRPEPRAKVEPGRTAEGTDVLRRIGKLLTLALLAAAGAWWGRLRAHSAVPRPEGRWKEIDPGDLG